MVEALLVLFGVLQTAQIVLTGLVLLLLFKFRRVEAVDGTIEIARVVVPEVKPSVMSENAVGSDEIGSWKGPKVWEPSSHE